MLLQTIPPPHIPDKHGALPHSWILGAPGGNVGTEKTEGEHDDIQSHLQHLNTRTGANVPNGDRKIAKDVNRRRQGVVMLTGGPVSSK